VFGKSKGGTKLEARRRAIRHMKQIFLEQIFLQESNSQPSVSATRDAPFFSDPRRTAYAQRGQRSAMVPSPAYQVGERMTSGMRALVAPLIRADSLPTERRGTDQPAFPKDQARSNCG